MSRTSRRRLVAFFVLLVVLGFAAFIWLRPLLNIGAGYAAKHACSCHFLQGRDLEEIRTNDLNFSVLGYTSLSKGKNGVRASFFGLVPREAIYRKGLGCTLINDPDQPLAEVSGAAAGAELMGKEPGDSVALNPKYNDALDYLMRPVAGGGTRGVVILEDGVIVGERYAEGYDENSLLLGWSMTKTLTGLLWGAYRQPAAGETNADVINRIVNRKGLYPEWAGDARKNIRLKHLFRMHSGLAWNEAYGGLSDATIMLHEYADMSSYPAAMPSESAPGDEWAYSSGTTNLLVDLLELDMPAGSIQQLKHLTFGNVAPSLLIESDQSGSYVGSSYGWATARDWARLGQFMLQDGAWGGEQILQPGWIDFLREPASGSDGTYGGQLWLPGPDVPSLPKDAYLMRGFQDQRVIVIPSRKLVIARLGHNDDKAVDFEAFVELLLR